MASHDSSRPNVVFILTDDQGAWALGCAGNTEIVTPALDRAAQEGVRFDSFFATTPVCSPARASLLTGEIPSQHGVHDWIAGGHTGPDAVDYLAGHTMITDLLAERGYRLGLAGKWHLGASDQPRPGFVHWYAHESGSGMYYNAPMVRDTTPVTEPEYLTYALTNDALQFLDAEAERDEPFWLSVNYTAPHQPWAGNHPDELTSLYADCPFDSCPQQPHHPHQRWVEGHPIGREPDLRESLVGYYASVTGVDRGVAQIRERLEELGLAENTLFVFTSDNGMNCGHHGIWGKGNGTMPFNMYDTAVKVPAIFVHPGRIPADRLCTDLISGYDMLPTLVDYLGLDVELPDRLPGHSFAPLLEGHEDPTPRDHIVVYGEYGATRMIRTHEWKYIHRATYARPELYHLSEDPDENHDLHEAPEYESVRQQMRADLDDWFEAHVNPALDGTHQPVIGTGQYERITHEPPTRWG